jgi:phospholipid transport system substrate-binding protein
MKQLHLAFLSFAILFSSGLKAAEAPGGKTYTGEAAKIKTQLETLFDASRNVNDAAPATKKTARQAIEDSMDWEQVAKECLGMKEWNKNTPANRNLYRDILQDVVVKTAYTRLDKFWDGATYQFTKIDVKGDKADVSAKYTVKGEHFSLDYYMLKKGATWKIYDVAFEDFRYSENIREQITAFLKDKGFPNLLDKLKKRREELTEVKAEKKG